VTYHKLFSLTCGLMTFPPKPMKALWGGKSKQTNVLHHSCRKKQKGERASKRMSLNSTLTAGGQASRSVAPSPIITTVSKPYCSFSMLITRPFPPLSAVGWLSSNPAYSPEQRNVYLANVCTSLSFNICQHHFVKPVGLH